MAHGDEDWEIDEGLDPEGPSADDLDRFGGEFRTCPSCGEEVYDQAVMCPVCNEVLSQEGGARSNGGLIGLIAAVVVIAIVLISI